MYTLYRVPNDAYDDPPICGKALRRFNNYTSAVRDAERTMNEELDPKSAYFVVGSLGVDYSCGLIS